MHGRVVEVVVKDSSSGVLDGVLDGCYADNDNEWHGVQGRVRGSKDLEDLQDVLLALH